MRQRYAAATRCNNNKANNWQQGQRMAQRNNAEEIKRELTKQQRIIIQNAKRATRHPEREQERRTKTRTTSTPTTKRTKRSNKQQNERKNRTAQRKATNERRVNVTNQ